MTTLLPIVCTASVENASDIITITGTDASTGIAAVLSDLSCRPNASVFIAGVGYLVKERLTTTTFKTERTYEGTTGTLRTCTIGVFTPEMANRAELSQQLREYSAAVALLREDWNGLVHTLIAPTGAADPGSGNIAFDNATPASITGMYLDVNDARGRTITGQVMTWRQGTQVRVQSLATGDFVTVELAATPTNEGPDQWISNAGLSLVESYGTLAVGEKVAIIYIPSAAGLDPDYTVELLAGRAAYDGAAAGIQVLVNDVGDGRAAIYTKLSATSADWSTAAYVTGGVGPQGDKGWSPQLVGVSDGARRVFKLAGYVGGAGSAPTANVGEYLKADGTFTATIGDAADFRGASGPAGIAGGGLKGIACRVVITTNVDLAGGGIAAGTTHGGVTLDANDLVLVAGQTAAAENGVYPAPAAGAATRHTDFDAWDDLVAAYFPVSEGTTNADTLWRSKADKGGTLGTTEVVLETVDTSTLTQPTLTLKQSASPTPTAEGDIQWDTDGDTIVVGDGMGQKTFYPSSEGTYTPVLTNTTNLDGSTAAVCHYLRVGNIVIVGGTVSMDATAIGLVEMGFSLPIASNIGTTTDVGGAAASLGTAANSFGIYGDATNNRATFRGVTATTNNITYGFTFVYRVI